MGANLSSEEKSQYYNQQKQSKYVMGKKISSSSIPTSQKQPQSIIQHSIDLITSNNGSNQLIESPMNEETAIQITPKSISEKCKGKLPAAMEHLDKLTPNNSSMINQPKKSRPQRASNRSSAAMMPSHPRERYSSVLSAASGFSAHYDAFQFSSVGDSVITDMSRFSFNSYMDHNKADNDYIMSVPDFEYPTRDDASSPSTDNVSTLEEILDLLKQYPTFTYDILTDIFASSRIRNNPDLQREAYQAAEVWSLRPDDVSAKVCVARCKLCGWGTPKDPKQGFQDLQRLAEKNNWEAYYHLAQCYYYGVEQVSEGYTVSGPTKSTVVIQPVDQILACSWYKKVISIDCSIQSDRIAYIVAQAKLLIAVTNFTTDQITRENLEENINYIKESAAAGNRKSEFLLALLLRAEETTDELSAKEYYFRSSKKGYTPSQIELGLLLLREHSSEGVSWLNKAAALGDPRAYHHLGKIYEFGIHVEVDHALALTNYQVAADNFNDRPSQFRLGFHYLAGTMGLERDDAKAFAYLSQAASHHHAESQYFLGIMYRDNKVPVSRQPLSATEISQNKKEALRLFRQSASQSIHAAIIETACCYEKGVGTAINHAVAIQYFEKAISIPGNCLPSAQLTYATFLQKNGKYERALQLYLLASGLQQSSLNSPTGSESVICTAKLMVALFYLDEKDTTTPYKPKEAFDMLISLSKGTAQQSGEVHYWIAVCYEEGIPGVVEPNATKSFDNYYLSAQMGYSNSQFQVGHLLCKNPNRGDPLKAFDWLQAAAKQNHPEALYYLGIFYYNGISTIPSNLSLATEYFKRSAELGNAESMVSCAEIGLKKVKSNALPASELQKLEQESLRWYKKAAHLGHLTAIRELGRIYNSKKDYKNSALYYEKAVKLNDETSTIILGGYYEMGYGVTMNKETAIQLYEKAIALGQPTAYFAIAELYDKLKNYDKAYSYYKRVTQDKRISPDKKSNRISRLKIALYGLNYDSNALLNNSTTIAPPTVNEPANISTALQNSEVQLLSTTEAYQTLATLANEDKFRDAYFWMARCYQDGKGVSQNTNAQLYWLKKAASEGDMNATMELASIYEHGHHGVEKDIPYAYQLYQVCGERNIVKSQHKLGVIFWRGLEIIPINLGMAVVWFTRSARLGYAPSHWALGQIALENGDLHIAIAWWETAMKLNPAVTHPYMNKSHLMTTVGGDSEALITLGKIIQQQESLTEIDDNASVTVNSGSTHSSIRDEVESLSRVQQENHGLAVQCFGQAAKMGNVEGMYLTAQAWHKDKEYPVALENFEKAASQGHIPSRIMCATYQLYGLGGKNIDCKAGYEELLFCSKYDSDAFIHLGRCYERGLGIDQDITEAIKWYRLSNETTQSSEAMFRLGQIYYSQGDNVESLYWHNQAICQDDHPRAHFRIAFHYIQGILINGEYVLRPDLSTAVQHFCSSAKQNDLDAMFELGQLLLSNKDDHSALFPLELQEEGLDWLEIAADKGSREAHRELGNLYHSGREGNNDDNDEEEFPICQVGQDFEKAYDHFSFAAHLGDKTSALFLGTYYEHGICVPPNSELAQTWYTVAIELGFSEQQQETSLPLSHPSGWWPAQLCLARVKHQKEETQREAYELFSTVYYSHKPEQHIAYLEMMLAQYELHGLGGITIEEEKGFAKIVHLAEQGYVKVFCQVAQCYENGIGVAKNLKKALDWYVALIHNPDVDQDTLDEDDLQDSARAYFCLAEFYRLGKVVSVDLEKSATLYQIAAERGSKEALNYLEFASLSDREKV